MDKSVLRWNFIFQYGYVITNIINSIILLPFYLKHIDAATLGVWLATGNILAWMTLFDPGIGEVLQFKIAELRGKKDNEQIGKTMGSGFIAAGIMLAVSLLAGVIFYSLIGVIINKDVTIYPNLQIALFISIVATGMSLISFSMSGINQGLHNASQVAISAILSNFLFLITNLTLLIMGFGLISIAFANLIRAIFINIYNYAAIRSVLKRDSISVMFQKKHFYSFIKIFSFTSLASIIGGLSASMDTIFLARFITPSMITVFEINKRPVQMSQSMIGRHSVALMPSISHAIGKGDRSGIISLISKQFKYYYYAAIFLAMQFIFNYHDLITAWTGKGRYAGNLILSLLVCNFFFGLIGYFMANMGYAVGDIKVNSFVNIVKGLILGLLFYVSAKFYGIPGLLSVMLGMSIVIDVSYFSYRLFQLGYLKPLLVKKTLLLWLVLLPVLFILGYGSYLFVNNFVLPDLYILRILIRGCLFTLAFLAVVFIADTEVRNNVTGYLKNFNWLKTKTV